MDRTFTVPCHAYLNYPRILFAQLSRQDFILAPITMLLGSDWIPINDRTPYIYTATTLLSSLYKRKREQKSCSREYENIIPYWNNNNHETFLSPNSPAQRENCSTFVATNQRAKIIYLDDFIVELVESNFQSGFLFTSVPATLLGRPFRSIVSNRPFHRGGHRSASLAGSPSVWPP